MKYLLLTKYIYKYEYLLSYFHAEQCTTGGIMSDDCPG